MFQQLFHPHFTVSHSPHMSPHVILARPNKGKPQRIFDGEKAPCKVSMLHRSQGFSPSGQSLGTSAWLLGLLAQLFGS